MQKSISKLNFKHNWLYLFKNQNLNLAMNVRLCLYGVLILGLFTGLNSTAQIRVSRVDINKWIKENFAGQSVVVGNIKFHGNLISIGAFSNSNNVLELQKGLVLS